MIKEISIPIKIALFSFLFGTALFLSHFIFPKEFYILLAGLFFVLLAILVNFITLLYLVRKAIIASVTNPKTTEEIFAIVLNIPIATLYLFIIFNQNNFY